jgi:hypothetical protein
MRREEIPVMSGKGFVLLFLVISEVFPFRSFGIPI